MLNKKSQLTVFMIMAVVALVIFGLVYFSRGQVTQTKIQAEEEKLVTNKIAAAQVEFYVQGCLDKSFQEGLELISRQGGYIMSEQRGSNVPFPIEYFNYTADNNTYLVSYRITRDQKNILPRYPCRDDSPDPRFCGYINDISKYKALKTHTYGSTKNAVLDSKSSFLTIQKQLEHYIENQTLECLNFSSFIGFNVTLGNATSNVTIQDEQVSATLSMPVTVLIQDVSPVIQKFKFSSMQKVRLKKIHNAVQELLNYDNRDLDFRLKEDGSNGSFEDQIFSISALNLEIEKVNDVYENDDLFIFTDYASRISGKLFKYMIMRQNRMPALDLVHPNSRNPDYDILISPGQRLEFEPQAADPDEDKIIYDYDGFTEKAKNIVEQLRDSMKVQEGDCKNRCASYEITMADLGEHIITIKASDGTFTDFQNVRINVVSTILPVLNIHSLYAFTDEKTSWQSFEDPVYFDGDESVTPEAGSVYNFIWTDSFTNNSDIVPIRYNQQITTDEFLNEKCIVKFGNEIKNCRDDSLLLDIKKPISLTRSIELTTGTNPQFSFNAADNQHNISLSIILPSTTDTFAPAEREMEPIKVKECLPNRNSTDNFKYPYPYMYIKDITLSTYADATVYNLPASSDDFQGNHTCCNDDGTLQPDTTVCFQYNIILGNDTLDAIDSDIVQILKTQLVEDEKITPSLSPTGGLHKLTSVKPSPPSSCTTSYCEVAFEQYCGNRGNACSGDIKYRINNHYP